MNKNSKINLPTILEKEPLQIGFIPDGDCAPLAVARESGLFEKYELNVIKWANSYFRFSNTSSTIL